jgi:diguanylate cyclase (GGDEF)-like protein
MALADRIRRRIAAVPTRDPQQRLTVSVGVALCPADAVDYDRLFETADKRLYEAKAAGRNCVVGERVLPADSPMRLVRSH